MKVGARPTDEPAAVWVPTDDLVPWADNPRKNAKAIPEVVESIKLVELSPHYCDVIRRRWGQWAAENGQDLGEGALASTL